MNQNLKLRILTAVIGLMVIMTLLLFLGIEGVAFFAWVISIGMLYEYCRMFFSLQDAGRKTAIAILFATFIHVFNYIFNSRMSAQVMAHVPVFIFFILFLFMIPQLLRYGGSEAAHSPEGEELITKHVQELMALCFGLVYCVGFPMLMVAIRSQHHGKYWILFGLLIVWSNDTFAYFGGKRFGRHFLFETISPKKTKEGALAGVLGAIIAGYLFGIYFLPTQPWYLLLTIILTVSGASILGDLAESLLKRASKKKDSGSILPGHGGFLDRFDGVVFAIPTLYLLLWFFNFA